MTDNVEMVPKAENKVTKKGTINASGTRHNANASGSGGLKIKTPTSKTKIEAGGGTDFGKGHNGFFSGSHTRQHQNGFESKAHVRTDFGSGQKPNHSINFSISKKF